jgi:hypothetical protein
MNCSGHPLTDTMARTIEGMNLYCEYNRAWLELYLNTWKWMTPYGWLQAYNTQEQNKDSKTR